MVYAFAVIIAFLAMLVAALVALTMLSHVLSFLPFVPTPPKVVAEMVRLAKLRPGEKVYDLGAGDGRLVIAAARQCPGVQAVGYEIAIGVLLLAKWKCLWSGTGAKVVSRDFLAQHYRDADVIFLYVTNPYMKRLADKFARELRPGTRIISHAFKFTDRKPVASEVVIAPFWGPQRIFVYRWTAPSRAKAHGRKRNPAKQAHKKQK